MYILGFISTIIHRLITRRILIHWIVIENIGVRIVEHHCILILHEIIKHIIISLINWIIMKIRKRILFINIIVEVMAFTEMLLGVLN